MRVQLLSKKLSFIFLFFAPCIFNRIMIIVINIRTSSYGTDPIILLFTYRKSMAIIVPMRSWFGKYDGNCSSTSNVVRNAYIYQLFVLYRIRYVMKGGLPVQYSLSSKLSKIDIERPFDVFKEVTTEWKEVE